MFNSSPVNEQPNLIRLLKLSPGVSERCVVLSETMEGIQSHYTSRTVICGGPDCPLCFEGRPTRYLGFVVVEWRLGRALLRLTSIPATTLMGMQCRPGLCLDVTQKNRRTSIVLQKQGYVAVTPESTVSQIELLNCLAHLFGVGAADFDLSYEENIGRLQVLACKTAAREKLPMSY